MIDTQSTVPGDTIATKRQAVRMQTIGMLGGMSWESTASYYKAINTGVRDRLGGFHSAKICLYSLDFAELEALQQRGEWAAIASILGQAAEKVAAGGADFLIICTNTMHKVADEIEQRLLHSAAQQQQQVLPIVHIVEATAERLVQDKRTRVGLLGTRFTMEEGFYKDRLEEKFNISVITPQAQDQAILHRIIFEELCCGQILPESRAEYARVIEHLQEEGVEAVILGCTEIALLIGQEHSSIPLYDTTQIHAEAAVVRALSQT